MALLVVMHILLNTSDELFIAYIMITMYPYQTTEKYEKDLGFDIINVPLKNWFQVTNRIVLDNILQRHIKELPNGLLLWQMNYLSYFYNGSDSLIVTPILKLISELSVVFITRINPIRQQPTKDFDCLTLKQKCEQLAYHYYHKLPLQQDLFEKISFEQMPDWFKYGIWITKHSSISKN